MTTNDKFVVAASMTKTVLTVIYNLCCADNILNHVSPFALPLETFRKGRKGKSVVTIKQYIGTPALVHFLKNLDAWPSSAREYRERLS
jgi:hypothetical protein